MHRAPIDPHERPLDPKQRDVLGRALLERVVDGDLDAAARWIDLYSPYLWGYLFPEYAPRFRHLCSDVEERLREVRDDALFVAVRYAEEYEPEREQVGAWLWRIADRMACDALTALVANARRLAGEQPVREAGAIRTRLRNSLRAAIAGLQGLQREVAEAEFLSDGMRADTAQLAARLGVTTAEVEEARTRYRAELAADRVLETLLDLLTRGIE